MLVGAEKLAALFIDKFAPRSVRFFRRVIGADVNKLPSARRSASHKTARAALARDDTTRQLTRVATVPLVLLACCLTEVFPAVIRRVTVFVVNCILGPFACLHDPNQAMSSELPSVHEKPNMAIAVRQSRCPASPTGVPPALRFLVLEMVQGPGSPDQHADIGIVGKAFAQIHSTGIWRFVSGIWIVLWTPQIVPAIIRYVSVLVFNGLWPRSCLHSPNQTIGGEGLAVYSYSAFTVPLKQANGVTGPSLIPTALGCRILKMIQRTRFPFENAGLGIIRKALL